jgi:hypothetical protein
MAIVVRWFLAPEAAVFGSVALMHADVFIHGYEQPAARIAESVIALVLLVGLGSTVAAPESSRGIGLGAQGFALFGTAVGIFTIALGVGPRDTRICCCTSRWCCSWWRGWW